MSERVYLPSVHGNPAVTGTGDPYPYGRDQGDRMPSEQENALALLIMRHDEQRRESMHWHPLLAQTARAHALDMGRRDYFSHTNPEGYGPNRRLTLAGYTLPDHYPTALNANSVESIAAGYPTAEEAFGAWMNSQSHRNHALGLLDFYAAQVEYGIGWAFVAGSTYTHYWTFISAPPE